jgi:hypothetical protein
MSDIEIYIQHSILLKLIQHLTKRQLPFPFFSINKIQLIIQLNTKYFVHILQLASTNC